MKSINNFLIYNKLNEITKFSNIKNFLSLSKIKKIIVWINVNPLSSDSKFILISILGYTCQETHTVFFCKDCKFGRPTNSHSGLVLTSTKCESGTLDNLSKHFRELIL